MSNATTVYTGIWVNHDFSPAIGATLTVPIRYGNFLIAALSSLVTWAGTATWSIVMFYLHQRFAAREDKDMLDQQLQVLFRSSSSVLDSIWDAINLRRAWRGNARKVHRRLLPLIVLGILLLSLFVAAGVLVAEVASKSYASVVVLAMPKDCGDPAFKKPQPGQSPDTQEVQEWQRAQEGYIMRLVQRSRDYATRAYNGTDMFQTSFVQARLPWTEGEVDCPWKFNTSCLGFNGTTGAKAWRMDTGPLSSHAHFGINASPENRITWRKAVTCGVLDWTNLATPLFQVPEQASLAQGIQKNVTIIGVRVATETEDKQDSTFQFSIDGATVSTGYIAGKVTFRLHTTDSKRLTHRTFNTTDSDVSVHLIRQGDQKYNLPVYDPLYLATRRFTVSKQSQLQTGAGPSYTYQPSKYFAILACNEQLQICNPTSGQCSGLTGVIDVAADIKADKMGFNSIQKATAMRMATIGGFFHHVTADGQSGLAIANRGSARSVIPGNMWIFEARTWMASYLSYMQNGVQIWVTKPYAEAGKPEAEFEYLNTTDLRTAYERWNVTDGYDAMCANQLINTSAAVQNFSVLATSLVIFLCVTLIVISATLSTCVQSVRSRRQKKHSHLSTTATSRKLAHFADEKYALLAMALRETGFVAWEKGKGDIPIMRDQYGEDGKVELPRLVSENKVARYASSQYTKSLASTSPSRSSTGKTSVQLSVKSRDLVSLVSRSPTSMELSESPTTMSPDLEKGLPKVMEVVEVSETQSEAPAAEKDIQSPKFLPAREHV